MLEGKCPKCGTRFYGWALKSPQNQMCGSCGVALIITDERGNTFTGYSPFAAEEYKAKSTQKMPVTEINKKTK